METPSGDKGRLSGRFEGFEHKPSDGMFERIAAANERRPGALGPRFARYTHPVRPRTWGRIERALRPVYLRRAWWMGAVAGLAMLGGFAAWRGSGTELSGNMGEGQKTVLAASFGAGQEVCGDSAWLAVTNRFHVHSLTLAWPFTGYAFPLPPFQACGGVLVSEMPFPSGCTGYPMVDPIHVPGPQEVKQDAPEAPALPSRDSVQEEYFPEIELPQGDEAEGAWGLRVGSTMSQTTTVAQDDANLMERDGFFSAPLGLNASESQDLPMGTGFERYEMPVVFGVTLDMPLSKRIHLLPGVQYTLLRSELRSTEARYNISRHYLGLSLGASYDVIQGARTTAYVMLATQADAGLGTNIQPGGGTEVAADHKAGQQLSALTAAGVSYMFTQHLGLYGQAQANIMVLQTEANLYTQKPIWPSAQVGLKVKL